MPDLAITAPDGQLRRLALEEGEVSLGRSAGNDLPFPGDDALSRHHLSIQRTEGAWFVSDSGSKNGTFLNGARVARREKLRPGDVITAGHVRLVFGDGDAPPDDRTVTFDSPPAPVAFTATTSLANVLAAHRPGADRRDRTMTALLRAGRELAARRPLRELFPLILDLAIDSMGAERGVVLAMDEGRLKVEASRGEGFRISAAVRDRVLEQRNSLLVRDTSAEESLRDRMSIVTQGVQSFMAVPLQTDERVFGLLYVDTLDILRGFDAEDLDLLTVISNVAAIRIEHERLAEVEQQQRVHEAELQQAADIQRRFLPQAPPRVAGIDLAGFNAACRTVGGDYFDFLPWPDGRLGLVLGDVAGKGMPAALMMTNLQARVTALAESACSPAEMVTRLNHGLAAHCPGNRFVTFFLAVVDLEAGQICYTNAGHNPTLIARAGGAVERLEAGGPVLAILPSFRYGETCVPIGPGDLLLLYSDGVTEAENAGGEEFGEARLAGTLQSLPQETAAGIITAVRAAVDEWTGGRPLADDVTILAARIGTKAG